MRKNILLLVLSLLSFTTVHAQGDNVVVSTTSGQVSGIIQEGTMAWLGIPYAKVERFLPPQPVKKWKGIRKCDHWGPMTMQPTNREMTDDEMSEQCCVLNVWTTDTKGRHRQEAY